MRWPSVGSGSGRYGRRRFHGVTMIDRTRDLATRLLAPSGAVVVSVAAFADSLGVGSGNGEFGRLQTVGMIGGWCLIVAGLVAWKRKRRVVPFGLGPVAAVVAAAVTVGVIASLISPVPGWDCSNRRPDGWATCTRVSAGCSFEREFNLNDPDSWDLSYPDISCDL